MTDPGREKAGGKVVVIMLLVLVVLFGGGYAAAYAGAGDNVPRGTTIAGVDVGGMEPAAAQEALQEGLSDRIDEPIPVEVEGDVARITPGEAGLAVDYEASVEEAGGERSWSPGRLWDYYTGGDDLDAVLDVDEDKMAATVEKLVAEMGTLPRDGDLRFKDGKVRVVQPRGGEQVDGAEARAALEAAYLGEGVTAELDLYPAQPEIDEADVQKALDEFGNPAVSAPVTLVFGDAEITLSPKDYTSALAVKAEDGELVPKIKKKQLKKLVGNRVSQNGAPVDATVALVDGKPQVVPAKPGVSYEPEDVTSSFLELVTTTDGKRRMEVPSTVAKPEFTTKDAKALQIKEQVSTFTTYYPHADYRNVNLSRAAELVDGTVLKPGETFSLNDTVGERTRENGFTEGFIIADGVFREELGGGVSQMATTLFNAMFFAGLEDVEHKPHSFYIDRYPVGREATVVWGALDLRFKNDTEYGVLIDANVSQSSPGGQGAVTVTMYSTKVWDIESITSDRYNFTEEKTRTIRDEDCVPHNGYAGFDIDVTRVFRRPGSNEVVDREVFTTTYTPSDSVVCKSPND
ncbi:VanW family protein [Nocardioides sp. GCM10027113]|uniref:VanW family protein n=1 Tax=unclassified Nocardioides TaxID=2615069 RepID=UPI0036218E7B